MKNKLINLYILILSLTIFGFCMANSTYATSIISREDSHLDLNLADTSTQAYKKPKKILITQIETDSRELPSNSKLWVQQLYYYSITRQNFSDLPYNYLIDRDGVIYQGRWGYDGANPSLSEFNNELVIGYLSNTKDIPSSAENQLKGLLEEFASKYGISKDNIITASLFIDSSTISTSTSNTTIIPAKTTYTVINNELSYEIEEIKGGLVLDNSKMQIPLNGEITDLTYVAEVKSAEQLNVSLTLKNNDEFIWFPNDSNLYLSTANGGNSRFAINGKWDSFSKVMKLDKDFVLPGESIRIDFQLVPNMPPASNQSEEFVFLTLPNNKIENTQFKVEFNVLKGDVDFVRILPTGYGFLNVRACGYVECELINQVAEGEIFVFITEENGWVKIKYGEEGEGWVIGQYVERL